MESNKGIVRLDVELQSPGKKMGVEIAVSHFSDSEKVAKLRELELPTVEIRVPMAASQLQRDDLCDLILNTAERCWLYHPHQRLAPHIAKLKAYRARLDAAATQLQIMGRIERNRRPPTQTAMLMLEQYRRRVAQFRLDDLLVPIDAGPFGTQDYKSWESIILIGSIARPLLVQGNLRTLINPYSVAGKLCHYGFFVSPNTVIKDYHPVLNRPTLITPIDAVKEYLRHLEDRTVIFRNWSGELEVNVRGSSLMRRRHFRQAMEATFEAVP